MILMACLPGQSWIAVSFCATAHGMYAHAISNAPAVDSAIVVILLMVAPQKLQFRIDASIGPNRPQLRTGQSFEDGSPAHHRELRHDIFDAVLFDRHKVV